MATQDFIFPRDVDEPRHDQNMPEGVDTPVPQAWIATRPEYQPGNERSENEQLLGNAGPNVGYALKLVSLAKHEFVLVDSEHMHDVAPLIGEIAMRRASIATRAPVMADIRLAAHILGYDTEPVQGEEKWRPILVNNCGHDEHRRRIIVNSIPEEIISGEHGELHESISGWWEKLEGLF